MDPFLLSLAVAMATGIATLACRLILPATTRRSIQIFLGTILFAALGWADLTLAQGPAPTPTPTPPNILGISNDSWEKALLVILGSAVALVFQKILPWLWQRAGKVYDTLTAWLGWDPLGRFEKRYLNAMRREHGDLKLIGIRTEGVAPPKLEQVYVSLRVVLPRHATLSQRAEPERVLGVGVALREYPRLMVLGAPGAGKSTLLDYLTIGFAGGLSPDKRQALALKERYLPVYIPLRRCAATDKTLADALVDPAFKLLPPDLLTQCPASFFQKRLEQGKCLVLLDGLDEVTSVPHHQHRHKYGDLHPHQYSHEHRDAYIDADTAEGHHLSSHRQCDQPGGDNHGGCECSFWQFARSTFQCPGQSPARWSVGPGRLCDRPGAGRVPERSDGQRQ